ncbi:hypothetical protein PHYBLDRAFT_163944 [Phycomyces blakesleeanus NRRL 1555(-)]|uniref:Uncharacterized protein n=1 Tax=Phycomyces blakesleeanus (strain ATCC 8743b / DSM 1359 / FGSC 10004 / NBRC 33097 / NRRL 1555) TaxID=763407 RepID=A0A163B8V9_PHYB8|nr:hypothetical protein PHYBLDRAFT_163944 [Phycomyces blakesleeanus NRRL 1555(-)]OAD78851.1 hypothetical protein PHYBLDRAFT_163944 [Phycomyces blakesleeanus NRRL 1555(-)]|eukprot:XP_018296891.1 hypothetical protein PHYBLDRAFT_163944 [Phycomyces blakesleeanus NRRL 1555(-)]
MQWVNNKNNSSCTYVSEEHFDNMEVDSIDNDNNNDYDYENKSKGEYADENEEQNIEFDQEVDLPLSQEEFIFTAEDTITGVFVVDGNKIEEGNTGFDFEQEENFDETSGISIVESVCFLSFDNMPLYIRFVAVFIIIFHLIFLMESGGLILIEFCNTLLPLCDMSGALPLTINSLKHKTEFNMATDGIIVYIAYSQCHSIYPQETSQRVCTFKKFSKSAICNNNLFKVSTGNHSLSAMIYPFNSLKYALQQKFSKPDFRMIQIWRKCNCINEKNQLTMQELANGIVVPCGYVCIIKKIADGFSFMKADEWKSWCVIYSLFVLKHVLQAKNLKNWILFVDACHLLTKPSIKDKEIDEAHSKLQLFCTRFQTLYEKSAMTPNTRKTYGNYHVQS